MKFKLHKFIWANPNPISNNHAQLIIHHSEFSFPLRSQWICMRGDSWQNPDAWWSYAIKFLKVSAWNSVIYLATDYQYKFSNPNDSVRYSMGNYLTTTSHDASVPNNTHYFTSFHTGTKAWVQISTIPLQIPQSKILTCQPNVRIQPGWWQLQPSESAIGTTSGCRYRLSLADMHDSDAVHDVFDNGTSELTGTKMMTSFMYANLTVANICWSFDLRTTYYRESSLFLKIPSSCNSDIICTFTIFFLPY